MDLDISNFLYICSFSEEENFAYHVEQHKNKAHELLNSSISGSQTEYRSNKKLMSYLGHYAVIKH